MEDIHTETKVCTKCGRELPATVKFFHRASTGRDKLQSACKTCTAAYCKKWRKKNKERVRENHARWRKNNREKISKYKREYAKKNADKIRALQLRWKREHKTYHAEYLKEWQKKNPDKIRVYSATRRARGRGNGGTFCPEDARKQYKEQKGACFWCGTAVENYHIDHVHPLSLGGGNGPENIVITCPTCNLRKNNKPLEEWLVFIGWIKQ